MNQWRLLFPLAIFLPVTSLIAAEPQPPRELQVSNAKVIPIRKGIASQSKVATDGQSHVAARWSDHNHQKVTQPSGNWRLRWQQPANAPKSNAGARATGTATRAKPESASRGRAAQAVKVARFEPGKNEGSAVTTARFREHSVSKIRLTRHQALADPLDDPFGEGNGRSVETIPTPSVSLQPPATDDSFELPPARPRSDDFPSDFGPPPFDPAPSESGTDDLPGLNEPADSLGQPGEARPTFPPPSAGDFEPESSLPDDRSRPTPDSDSDAPAPPPSLAPLREPTKPCRRVYNGRNCCTEEDACAAHRKRVGDTSIQQISLDITPLMTVTQLESPADETYEEYEQELTDELRKAPARVWRNRAGEEVADGRMTNYRRGRVEIETADGSEEIPFSELSDDDMCFVTAWWNIPTECVLDDDPLRNRHWIASTFTWKASSLCHKPLYFQEVQLERYGHSAGPFLQPALSGAHFFLNIAALPYNMGLYPPYECRYPLGYYRPGDCAPWMVPPVPLSVRASLIAAGTYVGGVFVIP